MKWISNRYTKKVIREYSHLLPQDFDPVSYYLLHPDLLLAGIDNEEKAKEHYLLFGMKENRIYKKIKLTEKILENNNKNHPEKWPTNNNIMYFSPIAPDFDESSGGNRLLQILKILKHDLKYNVYFLCNGYKQQNHKEAVINLDIPFYSVENINNQIYYLNKYIETFKSNNICFETVIFSWYDIAAQYLNFVLNNYPNIKVVIDSVDVHWLREQRGKNLGDLTLNQESLNCRKDQEKNIYSCADVVFAVTENDRLEIENNIGQKNIKILSNIHHKVENIQFGNNIFFIGNYLHTPNVRAAIDCIDIFYGFQKTDVYKKLDQKPKLLLAGPKADSKILDLIKNNSIIYLDKIDNLIDLYKQSCLLLAPLYWGAGIKGKICDSAMSGIPILTSDIGNEGINLSDKINGLIANNNKDFIDKLCYFFSLSNTNKILLGQNGQNHLNNIVSINAAKSILKHTIEQSPVLISIVAYNQTDKLSNCLDSILSKTKYNNYHILITNNGNNKKVQDIINTYTKKYSDKISFIQNKTNLYFIQANNNVFKNKKYLDYDIVLLNDDTIILSEYWLNYLNSSAYSADYIACAGGKSIYPDGRLAEAGAELYNDGSGKNKGRYEHPDDPKYNYRCYTGYCSGCLLYIRRDALNKIGFFNTNLDKMYYEDAEWQYRAHIKGLKTIYEPRCEIIHDEGSSAGIDIGQGMKKYQEINKLKFLEIIKNTGCDNIEQYN